MIKNIRTILKIKKLNKAIDNEALSRIRINLENYLTANPSETKSVSSGFLRVFFFRNKFVPVFIVIFLLIMGSGGLAYASQPSLPGDLFYPIKLLSEDIIIAATFSQDAKMELRLYFAEKRIEELKTVMQKGNIEPKKLEVTINKLNKYLREAEKATENGDKNKNSYRRMIEQIKREGEGFQSGILNSKKMQEGEKIQTGGEQNIQGENTGNNTGKEKETQLQEREQGKEKNMNSNDQEEIIDQNSQIDETRNTTSNDERNNNQGSTTEARDKGNVNVNKQKKDEKEEEKNPGQNQGNQDQNGKNKN